VSEVGKATSERVDVAGVIVDEKKGGDLIDEVSVVATVQAI
jgi:hypothetical protein